MFDISWQDAVLTVGNCVFFIALLPSIFGPNKPSKWTSLSTAATLTAFTATYLTLSLAFAPIATGATALAWWVLYFQKRKG
ncbi:MAG TPA: hypothetical protein VFS75_03375 [Candidatus Paceibacterota bacterium]|nr:hypothetical protein [Candidatus Paceibacterota bacterium]